MYIAVSFINMTIARRHIISIEKQQGKLKTKRRTP